jgi:Fe2+ or Zn2+ uptake regulation protein
MMLENHVGVCEENEHDWCAIPLHEEAQICARCGQIKESQLSEVPENEDLDKESFHCHLVGCLSDSKFDSDPQEVYVSREM